MSTVLEQIEQQIAKLSSKAVKKNTGNIRTVADGVAKIDGLSDVMYNEMVQFPGGAIGIALNLEEDAAESGLFDIIGHADLCKFAFIPQQDCTLLFTRFLQAAKRRGVAVELNTAGLRKECREIYPSPRIVQMATAFRVPITFASDAHPTMRCWRPSPTGPGRRCARWSSNGARSTPCAPASAHSRPLHVCRRAFHAPHDVRIPDCLAWRTADGARWVQ